MPTVEVPTSPPPGAPPEPPRSNRSGRYEDYDTHDLLSVIEELEGNRNWVSLREKVWIALIVHMIVLWFLMYGPKYIFHQRIFVRDNSALLRNQQKHMTYLETPSDIKPMTPKKPTPFISNKNHVAQSPHPTLDKKTLQQLEAMRRAGPPVPRPSPQPPSPRPTQQATAAPPAQQPRTPAQPLPTNQKSPVEAPAPAAPTPNFNTGHRTPGEEMQQMARNASRGSYGGDMGANAPSEHPGNQGAVDVLSDTMGVDFGPYIQRVIYDTKRAWYPIIPEAAQPPLLKQGRVGIRFRILPN
ncbi:MAG TPA: hypothetical protein VG267_00140, partial [Terracidiphilus sp.]|nr:hypothetical protein [Terracidiphilus sp.]